MDTLTFRNFYATLSLLPTATASQIQAAHRRLYHALQDDCNDHPENWEANKKALSEINDARTVLVDPKTRGRYDEIYEEEMKKLLGRGKEGVSED